ncbi:MAG: O-acetylserine/cysteine exporter [Alphaproteobacteria bacterium]|nr:O-acetylserine/cysteine exporter [Alphaproteobacteria bacterium]
MSPVHLAAAALVVVIWGFNFSAIRLGLDEMTPLCLAGWRFALAALPVLFIARPDVPLRVIAGVGIFQFGGQFVFLFYAMEAGLPPGLVSVLVQLQGPLTFLLAAAALGERARPLQWLGLAIALAGVAMIARSVEGSAPLAAVALGLLSALSWATGNLFMRHARGGNLFAVTVWASALPALPLLAASLVVDGPTRAPAPLLAPTGQMWAVLLYSVAPAMWLGYFIWGTLLRGYPAARVGPISLLIPCVALGFAALLFGEQLAGLRLVGVIIVLAGVAAGLFAGRERDRAS